MYTGSSIIRFNKVMCGCISFITLFLVPDRLNLLKFEMSWLKLRIGIYQSLTEYEREIINMILLN